MGKNKRGDDDEVFDPADFDIPPSDLEESGFDDDDEHDSLDHSPDDDVLEIREPVEELSAQPGCALKAFDRVTARQPGREPPNTARERWTQRQYEAIHSTNLEEDTPSVNDTRVLNKFADVFARSNAQLRKRLGF